MKVGDLVRVKKDKDLQFGVGIVIEVQKQSSRARISWASEVKAEWSEIIHLEVVNKKQTNY